MDTETDDLLSSMMLWSGGNRYLEAARTLFAQEEPSGIPMPPSEPLYFLACQAIELALKGFLRGCGKDEDFLARTCQHNLLTALKAAEENGLTDLINFESKEREVLNTANNLYSSKALQFGIEGKYRYPPFGPLLRIAEKLVAHTEAFCLVNSNRHAGKPTAVQKLRKLKGLSRLRP